MEAIGPVLIVLSIPLLLRWIPPNRFYGFRIPATCRNPSIWYDANALNGRHLLMLGLVMVGLEYVLPLSIRNLTLGVIAGAGLITIIVADSRTATRWERERGTGPDSRR